MDMSNLFGFESSSDDPSPNEIKAARDFKRIVDSYVMAGFTRAEAISIVIGLVRASAQGDGDKQ